MKKLYRQSLINKRNTLSKEDVDELSSRIIANFLKSPESKKISTLGVYKAIKTEVKLDQLFKKRPQNYKNLTFPVVGTKHSMNLVMPNIGSEFKKNKYGVLEPCNGKIIEFQKHDAIIVPAVGVDKNGYRLGYGGGYYDRFLAPSKKIKNKPKIFGLVFSFQLIDDAISENHDIKFDKVFTEDSVINFSK